MSFSLPVTPPNLPNSRKYGSAFLSWKADGSADMDLPLRLPQTPLYGTAKMSNGGYTIEPGTPFYNYMKGYRSKISGAGGYF